ncbi:hypothetical protein LEP1GSC013_1517 [Leptospira interrogans serovar Valbuzzi str. Duyster]|nr:hypothetical protein LEP1GSC013_1517 [Leptospira interrogans serovar Valbuzzi str. Duyster]ENO71971.1 hypothetical protein LEP1GSC012_2203 [Leptospira interrogans serovar Valbuzzi str. Valbuzzi]
MVVPTFEESICKVQILTLFRIMSSLRRTHVKINEYSE